MLRFGVASLLLGFALTAHAGSGYVVVGGNGTAHDQDVARTSATTAFAASGWATADKPLDEKETASLAACFKEPKPAACSARVAHGRAKWFALVNIAPAVSATTGRQVQITTRVIVENEETVFVEQRFCDHCSDDTLAALVTEATKAAINQVVLNNGHAVLSIKSTPQRARFTVDGSAAGITDAAIDVLPGPHTVTIESNGFEPASRSVNAVEGKTVEVSVTLQPVHSGESSQQGSGSNSTEHHDEHAGSGAEIVVPPPHRSHLGAYALIGAGGAAVIGGAVALALDESPVAKPKGQEQPQYYTDTTVPGFIALGAGAVAVAVGVYWLVHDPKPSTTAAIAPTNGGAVVGLSGSF